MKKEPLENQLSKYKEETVWPNVNEIRYKAIIDYKDIKEGMRIIDTFIFGPNESDIIDLPCIITSVEYGDFKEGEFTFHCRYTYQALNKNGEVLSEASTCFALDNEIEAGDVGIIAYFESKEEAQSFGVDPSNLNQASLCFQNL